VSSTWSPLNARQELEHWKRKEDEKLFFEKNVAARNKELEQLRQKAVSGECTSESDEV